MRLDVRLLGTFAVLVDGEPVAEARWTRRQAALIVKLLALAPHQRLHQEQIMETLWPGADPAASANGLHKMVHLARHALEPGLRVGNDSAFLQRSERLLQLTAAGGVHIDADEFEHAALRAVRDADEGAAERALRLYEGDLLPSERFADWASARRDRLRALRLEVFATLAGLQATRGELAAAIRTLQQLLAVDATNEPAHRMLMELFARAGARAQALRQYEHCRTVLRRELDEHPDAATTALRERIAAGVAGAPERDPAPVAAAKASPRAAAAGREVADAASRGDPTGTIAVLPFANLTGDVGREHVANGLADAVIRDLSRQSTLRVMAPSAVLRYRGREIDPRSVGRELGVASLLLGRLEPAGADLAISIELVRVVDGTLLWGERFEGDATRLQEFEHAIASGTIVRVAGDGRGRSSPPTPSTSNPRAYEHYLRGRLEWTKRNARALADAQRHFERAIAADGRFALAHSGLADCLSLATLYAAAAPHDAMPKALAAAERALAIDPDLAEAHTSLAYVQFAYEWDFAAAERSLLRAIELAPNYATAHQWLHELMAAQGRVAEQQAAVARAHALDPLSPLFATEIGWGMYFAGDSHAACRHLERTVAAAPQFALAWLILGLVQLQSDDVETACQTLAHAVRSWAEPTLPLALGSLGHALARAGRSKDARQVLRRLGKRSASGPATAYARALVHAGLGEHDGAFDALETALAGHADRLVYLGVEPMFASLREDERFDALRARMRAEAASPAPTVAAARPRAKRGKKAGRRRQAPRQRRGSRGS